MNDEDAFYLMVADDLLTAFSIRLRASGEDFPAKAKWLHDLPKAGRAVEKVIDAYTAEHPKWWANEIEGIDA